jgi:hypothetical protein
MKKILLVISLLVVGCTYDQPYYNGSYYANNNNSAPVSTQPANPRVITTVVNTYAPYWSYLYYQGYYGGGGWGNGWGYGCGWGGYRWSGCGYGAW